MRRFVVKGREQAFASNAGRVKPQVSTLELGQQTARERDVSSQIQKRWHRVLLVPVERRDLLRALQSDGRCSWELCPLAVLLGCAGDNDRMTWVQALR